MSGNKNNNPLNEALPAIGNHNRPNHAAALQGLREVEQQYIPRVDQQQNRNRQNHINHDAAREYLRQVMARNPNPREFRADELPQENILDQVEDAQLQPDQIANQIARAGQGNQNPQPPRNINPNQVAIQLAQALRGFEQQGRDN